MMRVRLADLPDLDEIVAMAKVNSATRPHLTFNETRCRASFVDYLTSASPTFWVVEDDRGIAGFLVADFYVHRAFDGLFTTQEVLFVKPEKRGTRAATLLMRQLTEWSKALGANEIVGGNDNDFNSESTAEFLGHFGFKKVGYAMRLEM